MIRVRHITLPAGLAAIVRRDSDGGLVVVVSDSLTADRQRAAVRLAVRSMRRPGWRAALFPLPIGLLASFWRGMRPVASAPRTHAIASSVTAFLLAAGAAALIIGLPPHHGPATAGQRQGPGHAPAEAPGRTPIAATPGRRHTARPEPRATAVAGGQPVPVTATPATPSAAPSAPQPRPAPSRSATAPQSGSPSPASSPSPSPPSSGGVTCVVLLGIWVCL